MADEIEYVVTSVPMLDTGIGVEAGYASDKGLLEAAARDRAALPPTIRDTMDEADRRMDEAIFGLPRPAEK